MSRKSTTLTISLSKELKENVEELQNKYNISALCQGVIEHLISIENCKRYRKDFKEDLYLQNKLSGIGINLEDIIKNKIIFYNKFS